MLLHCCYTISSLSNVVDRLIVTGEKKLICATRTHHKLLPTSAVSANCKTSTEVYAYSNKLPVLEGNIPPPPRPPMAVYSCTPPPLPLSSAVLPQWKLRNHGLR